MISWARSTVAVALLLSGGCIGDPNPNRFVIIDNQTRHRIRVKVNGQPLLAVFEGNKSTQYGRTVNIMPIADVTAERIDNEKVVFSKRYEPDELKKLDADGPIRLMIKDRRSIK